MNSVNKIFVLGNVGRDPETRYMPNGDAVTNFSVATTRYWKDKEGTRQEETEWHRCVAFGRTAEIVGEFLPKGNRCHVEGRVRTRKWTDKEDVERYTTEIVVDNITLLERKGDRDDDDDREERPSRKARRDSDDDRPRRDRDDDRPSRKPAPAPKVKGAKGALADPLDEFDEDIPW